MPEAEDRSGQCRERHRREVRRCKRHAKGRVLHTDFDGKAFALREFHVKDLAENVAEQKSETVVQNHDGKNEQACLLNRGAAHGNDSRQNQHNCHYAYQRERR